MRQPMNMKYFCLIIFYQLLLTMATAQSPVIGNKTDTVSIRSFATNDTSHQTPAEKKLLLAIDQIRYSPQGVNITQIGAGFSIKAKRDHLIFKFNSAVSEHSYGAQLFSEYYHNISKKDYFNILLAGSDGKFHPSFIGGFSNFYVPGKGWELSLGARVYAPKNDARSLVFPVGVSKQIGKHFFGYTLYMVEQKDQLNYLSNFNYRYYFSDNQFVSLNYSTGNRYNIFQPENVTGIPETRMKAQTFNVLFTTPVSKRWGLEVHFTFEQNKDPEGGQNFNIYIPGVIISRKI
jgi:YaiO family outer membrane protein